MSNFTLAISKPLTVWITINCGKFWKRWEYQTTWYSLLRNLYADQEATVRTGHSATDWFQIGKGVHQGCIFSPAYLTYMQSTSWEMLGWKKHKLESRLPGEISITSDMQMTPTYAKKWRTKEPLDESERGEWKVGLKLNIQKRKIMASSPIISWQIDGKKWKQWQILFSWAPKSLQMVTAAMKWKDTCSLEGKLWLT